MQPLGRFTDRAKRALNAAHQEAIGMRLTRVGTEHLLLGLLSTDDRVPPAIADKLDHDRARAMVEALQEPADPSFPQSGMVRMEFSPRMKKLLDLSFIESRKLGQTYVSVEHFWLAMLRETDGTAVDMLREAGVDFGRARVELIQMLRQDRPANEAPVPEDERSAQRRGGKNEPSVLAQFSRDLTTAARSNELDPVIGRDT